MGTRREGGRRSGGGGGGGGGGGHTRHKAVSTTTTSTNSSTTAATRYAKLENERRNQETLKRLAGLQHPQEETPAVICSPDGVVLKPPATLSPVIPTEGGEDFNKLVEGNNGNRKTKSNSNDIGNNRVSREAANNAKNKWDSGGCEERQRSRKTRDVMSPQHTRDVMLSQQTRGSPINGRDSSLGRDVVRRSEGSSAHNGRGRDPSPTKRPGTNSPGTPAKPRSARNASPIKGRSTGGGVGGPGRDASPVRAPGTPCRRDTSPVKAASRTARPTSASLMSSSLSSTSSPSNKMPGVFDRLTKSESSKTSHTNSASSPRKTSTPTAGRARARSPTKSQREASPCKTTGKNLATSTTNSVDLGESSAKGGRVDDRAAPRTLERSRGGLATESRGLRPGEKAGSSSQSSCGNARGGTGQSPGVRGEQARSSHFRGRDAARTATLDRTTSSKAGNREEKGAGGPGTDATHQKAKSRNRTPSKRRSTLANDHESEGTPRTSKASPENSVGGTEGRGKRGGTGRPIQSPQASSGGPGPTSSSKASHHPRPRRPPSGSFSSSLHSSTSTSSITSLASSTSSSSSFTATSPSPHSPSPSPSPVPSSKNIRGGNSQGLTNCSAPAAASTTVQRASVGQEKRLHSREERTPTKTLLTEEKPKKEAEKKKAKDKDPCKATTAAGVTSCSTGKKRECDEEEKDVCDGDEDDEGEFYKVRVQTRLVTYRDSTLVIRNTSKVAPTGDQEHGGTNRINKSSSAGSVCGSDGGSEGEGGDGGGVPTTATSGTSSLFNQGDSHGPHPAATTATSSTTAPIPEGLSPSLQTSLPPEVLQGISLPTPTAVTRHQRHHSDGALVSFGAAKGTARTQNVGVAPEGDDDGAGRDPSRLASLRGVRGRLSEFVSRGKLLVTDVCGAAAAQLPDMRRLQAKLTGGGSPFFRGGGLGGGVPLPPGSMRESEPCRTPRGGTVDRLCVSTPSSFSGVGELVDAGSEEGEGGCFTWRQAISTPAIARTVSLEEPSPGGHSQPCLTSTAEGQETHHRDVGALADHQPLVSPATGEHLRVEEAGEEEKAAKERQEREEFEKDPACKEFSKPTVLSTSGGETSRTQGESDTKGLESLKALDGLSGKEGSSLSSPRRCHRCNRIRKTRTKGRSADELLREGVKPAKAKGEKDETQVVDSNKLEGDSDKLEGDSNKLEEQLRRTLTIEQVAETVSKEELDRKEREKSEVNGRSKGEDGKRGESKKDLEERNDSNTILEEREEEEEKEVEGEVCTCTDASLEDDHDDISSSALKDEVRQLLDADHARMWWTITGNFGNILPIDWSKTCTRQQYLPVLNLNQNKKGDGAEEGDGEDEDGEDEEEVAQDLDLHQLILSGLNQEPVKSAEEVIKEIDDIMQEGSSSEDETSEEGKKSEKESDATTPTQAPLPPPLYEEKLKNLSLSELNEVYMELEMVIRQYSETLISQLALRDELEYEKELKNSFISLLLQVQNKRRHFNVEKKKHKKTTGPNGTDPKYLTTVIPYDVGHGPPDNQTLQILIKILTAINEDSPTVPTLLTDYILKVLCPS